VPVPRLSLGAVATHKMSQSLASRQETLLLLRGRRSSAGPGAGAPFRAVRKRRVGIGQLLAVGVGKNPREALSELARVHGDLACISGHGTFERRRAAHQRACRSRGLARARVRRRPRDRPVILASLKQELGDLDRVTGWVKALGFVKCAEGFNVTPAAINGFSDLVLALWGDAGRHARSAIGAANLHLACPSKSRRSPRSAEQKFRRFTEPEDAGPLNETRCDRR
jgi:hypothetical protein